MARFKVSDEQLKYYDEENTINKPQVTLQVHHVNFKMMCWLSNSLHSCIVLLVQVSSIMFFKEVKTIL